MNSLDPWRVIAIDEYGDVVLPRPEYQHPFNQRVPSWIHYGEGNGTTRQLFDGAFIGSENAGAAMSNGITFKKELDEHQVLHVEICVDGKCYRTSMDLAPAIAMIMTKLAQSHADLHRAMAQPADVVASVDRAVGVAGDALIGMLADRHRREHVAVGGFFDDIGHALSGAANAVGGALKSLKGPASLAAGAAATAFGGPAAGPIAAQLTGSLIDAAPGGGHPATRAVAQKTVASAKRIARTNPTVQTALDAAHHATSQVTMAALGHVPPVPATQNTMASAVQKFLPLATSAVTGSGDGGDVALPADLQSALSAFGNMLGGGSGGDGATVSGYPAADQVAQIIRNAKAGDPQARQALTNMRAAAARGDHEAKEVLHAARRINHTPPAAAAPAPAPVGAWVDLVGGWYDVVGAAIDDTRSHAQSIAGANNASVVGVIRTARGVWQSRGFRDADSADNWLGTVTTVPEAYTYAAIFDKDDVMWPHPLNEKVGTAYEAPVEGPPIRRGIATASGY